MKVSVAAPPSRRALKDTLEEFACLIGTTVSLDGSSGDSSCEKPKTRLDLLLSSQDEWAATLPSLSLSAPKKKTAAPSDSRAAAHLAEAELCRPLRYDRAHISNAPESMARSVVGTFESLVYANLRSFAKMRDGEKSWDASAAKSFRNVISNDALIRVRKVCSKFTTDESSHIDTTSCQLPLHANFSFDVDVDGINEHVSINSIGQISGFVAHQSDRMKSVKIELDCPALLLSLRQQARLVAYKIVSRNVSSSVIKSATSTAKTPQLAPQKNQVVTPCSSPLLSILSEAAATVSMEPMNLGGMSHKRRAAAATECKALPPKKRVRRAITPPLMDTAKQAMTGLAVLAAIAK